MVAVVVLYGRSADASEAVVSLLRLLGGDGEFGGKIEVMICDNSPYAQEAPAGFAGVYVQDLANPGLARRYNQALQRAEQRGARWLMLLDQDTTVTEEYIREVVAEAEAGDGTVVGMVPKLVEAGVVCSPAHPPMYGPARPVDAGICGVSEEKLHVFNSGAVVRVGALRSIGGFPERYPLDYLDHATFRMLQTRGRLLVLRSALQHELSSNDQVRRDAAFAERQGRVLDAEYRFYAEFGSAKERVLRRGRLLRAAAGRVLRGKSAGQTWRMVKAAMRP